ncbi:MAG: glycosyltransferase [Tetragenococcus koreensis]|nr:glycosyltransferase [Tetragenococcus koreensis]
MQYYNEEKREIKVLFYVQYWRKGGIEKLLMYLNNYFNEKHIGYTFCVLTEDVPDPAQQFSFPKELKIYFRNYTPFNAENMQRLREKIIKIDPDVVVAMSSTRALYKIPRALVNLPYPIILSEHNASSQMVKSFHNSYRFYNSVRLLGDFNHMIFETFAENFPRKDTVRVVPNPVPDISKDVQNFTCNQENKIVHIGRFQLDQKQQDLLVKSFSHIAKKHSSWNLELYGSDWHGGKNSITELINQYNLEGRIKIFDATEKVAEVLSSSKIFAFPSAYEGFGLVAGEALSAGIPVVAFKKCGGVNEFVKDGYNGVLVDSDTNDSMAFSQALSKLIEDDVEREKIASYSKESVAKYSIENFALGWKSIIDEAAEKKGENRLLHLSDIEIDYIDLIASGYLFDKIKKQSKEIKKMKKVVNTMKKFYVYQPARLLYKSLKR